ncbi:MAG: cysteine--tRNA ligase, partial [Acidimicrobiales bacterium]|nr:cysteine--tRNA ligase [Acidimicrobiales bacterium]
RDGSLTAADRWSLLADFDRALGFGLAEAVDPDRAAVVDAGDVEAEMADLLERREAARAAKDYAAADAIRDEITGRGFDIVDTPEGPTVRRR